MKLTGMRENNKFACVNRTTYADEKKETIEREIQAESSFYDSYFDNHKDQRKFSYIQAQQEIAYLFVYVWN